jgi:uncharacterized membrane protein
VSRRSRFVRGGLAGLGAFLVDLWPVLLVWHAGRSGSVGDLSEVRFLGVGLVWALLVAVVAAGAMVVALRRTAIDPSVGHLDPWGAYVLGLGVYTLILTVLAALAYGLLLVDENQSLRSRAWLLDLSWVAGRLLAVVAAVLAAGTVLGRAVRKRTDAAAPAD